MHPGAWLAGTRATHSESDDATPGNKIQRCNAIKPKFTADPRVRDVQSERGGLGLIHVGTGSSRREFAGERKSSERLPQARERLRLAHRVVVAGGVLETRNRKTARGRRLTSSSFSQLAPRVS